MFRPVTVFRALALAAVALALGVLGGRRDAAAHHGRAPRVPIILPYPCATAPLPPGGLPVPPGVPAPPTAVPIPSPTPGGGATAATYRVCPQAAGEIPAALQAQALAEPWTIAGWNVRANPNVPYHPLWNDYRKWLGVRNIALPYSRCNPAVWKAGCP